MENFKDFEKAVKKGFKQFRQNHPPGSPAVYMPYGLAIEFLKNAKNKGTGGGNDDKTQKEETKPTYDPGTGAFQNMAAPASAAPALSQAAMEQPMYSQPAFANRAMANPNMGTPASSIGWNPYPPTMNGNMYSPITMETMPNTTQPQVGQLYNGIYNYNQNDIMRYLDPRYRGGV